MTKKSHSSLKFNRHKSHHTPNSSAVDFSGRPLFSTKNQTIRISGGIFRGRNIKTPGAGTHPMGARERLALFNSLGPRVENAEVLDVFAGSGALGLEALSRGAKSAVFVENNPAAAKIIKENLASLGLNPPKTTTKLAQTPVTTNPAAKAPIIAAPPTSVITASLETFHPQKTFNLILADPPYDNFTPETLNPLFNLLTPGGILVLSHPKSVTPPVFPGLILQKTRSYAAATLSFYSKA